VAVSFHEHQERYNMNKVKGLQLQGRAEALNHREVLGALALYVKHFPKAHGLSVQRLFEIHNENLVAG
jgi:uncharacterized protein YhbP (UPF0306 family)